ncbi:MAG TPA: sugar ABC transporter permease, partial [Cyanobacteria bacterium UBA8530]|nr:sugar ABC transporter permease [Cyanobacteria bacterium UBA8530]
MRHGRPGNPIGEIAKASAFALLVLLMTFALASYRGFPVPLVLVAGLAFFFNLVSTQTPFGRQIYAIGGNIEAAILSGIPVKRFV